MTMSHGNGRDGPIRFAVVGMGKVAQTAVLPAFSHTRRAVVAAVAGSDDRKLELIAERFGVPLRANTRDLDGLLRSGAIDAVYLATPNHLHCEMTLAAAEAGVHVLCERPMAVTVEECRRMIDATEAAGVRLMVAYRLHFEEMNLEVVDRCRRGELGEVRFFSSLFTRNVPRDDIRRNPLEQGGGALYDLGIFCINAARYVFRAEPQQVFATSERIAGSDADLWSSAQLRFPGGRVAQFVVGCVGQRVSTYRVVGSAGSIEVDHAYDYALEGEYVLARGHRALRRSFPRRDQFGPLIDHFAESILSGKRPEPSGHEGLRDVAIVRALHQSASCGIPIDLESAPARLRPDLRQAVRYTPVHAPTPVGISVPSDG
jgi:predicted dehydrogenase